MISLAAFTRPDLLSPGLFAWMEALQTPAIRIALTASYVTVLLLVATYGLHRYWLVLLYYRSKRHIPRARSRFEALPAVTVQLPMFNEAQVAARVIDAACRLDYPADRLRIQVLDDSTDHSAGIARRRVEFWQARGVRIEYHHREDRSGFKAGALAEGMVGNDDPFIAIFDADFIPPRHFLKRCIHHFTDPGVGMVQARWDHLNRNDSLLTRSQAVYLDGHFVIEHTARNRGRRWFNFNGTAGVWRRQAITDAGGWQADTLTEDVDLSYRAQLAGWRFVFLPRLTCPAELPPEINAFKAQQHRWTKGSIQVARKLLWRLMRAPIPASVKVEAFFHLTSPMVYLYITIMVLLFFPALYVNLQPFERGTIPAVIWGGTLFALGTCSAGVFYVASQREQRRSVPRAILQLPMLMSIGIGIALNNTRGVIEALIGHQSPFIRTPKYSVGAPEEDASIEDGSPSAASHTHDGADAPAAASLPRRALRGLPTPSVRVWMSLLELALGGYVLWCAGMSFASPAMIVGAPFLLLFATGYLYVGMTGLWGHWLQRVVRRVAVTPAPQA